MSCFKYSAGPFAVEIQASPKEVWAVLADFDGWQRWNPFMPKSRNLTRSDGAVQKGDMLESRLRDKMNFKTVITVAEPGPSLALSLSFLCNKSVCMTTLVVPAHQGRSWEGPDFCSTTGKELLWSSPPNGMMDGDHYFQLEQNPSGSTTFTQGKIALATKVR